MTIASENRKSGPYTGTGAVSNYPFDFRILELSDLVVTVADELGVESVLVLDSDYSVELNEDQDADPGGVIVLDLPLTLDHILVATSDLPATQNTNLSNQGGFYPAVVTAALDRLTILIQQVKVDVARSAKLPITRGEDIDELLADLILVADNLEEIVAIGGAISAINAVGAIAAEVVQLAAVASSIPTVAAIDGEVVDVAAIDTQVALLADISAAIVALADVAASIPVVAAQAANVEAVGDNIADVTAVAAALADIAAAVAALPDLAAKASLTGAVFSGPVEVPAGGAGNQVMRASEVAALIAAAGAPGQVAFFAQNTAPTGWLKADGSLVSRATYAALFTAIGTTYGVGDGSTTFGLPDMRGEFPRGWDDGRGVDASRAIGTAQLDQMQRITGSGTISRSPVLSPAGAFADSGNVSGTSASGTGSICNLVFDSGDSPDARVSATTAGETRPRNVALLACIKH